MRYVDYGSELPATSARYGFNGWLPEAMWLSFNPVAPETQGWTLFKVEQPVSPTDVVRGGNRHMHALSNGLSYGDTHGKMTIDALDVPLVALGEKSPIFFSNSQPDLFQRYSLQRV